MFCKHCGKEIPDNIKFCTQCGKDTGSYRPPQKKEIFTKKRILWGAVVIVAVAILVIAMALISTATSGSNGAKDQDIASAVVNIYCEGVSGWDGNDTTGGSGTIITSGGLVLTNAHIIPQDNNSGDQSCIVILPNPEDGSPDEVYYARPLVFPDISEKYDLAFVMIDDVYYDQEEGRAYGDYPRDFPAYDGNKYCKNENVKLGEPVRIYGYPAISGGYALTITDGVVSSLLPDEGLIVTSAKISHGNSGGLAVDKNGCRIGIPSMVTGDENESLGVIISNNLISDFSDEVSAALELNNQ